MTKRVPVLLFAFANERQNEVQYLRALTDERRAIEAALDPAVRKGLCEIKVLPNATLAEIFATFQDERYRDRIALFHYGGHAGGLELLLEKTDRENQIAHSSGLIPLLQNQKGLEMVFLNGCSTEKWALTLNEAGIPLVAGTFEAIRDEVARQLAAQFYSGLGQGMSLRRAWEEAIANVRSEKGDQLRNFGRAEFLLDRFPWSLFQRKGADKSNLWNLPDAAGDPLASLPLPANYDRTPLPNDPFRFLDRYRKADAPIFFGRGRDIRDLYDRLTNVHGSPVLLLSGQSGVGKSSLLEAGLLPRLELHYSVIYLRRNADIDLNTTLRNALNVHPEETLKSGWLKMEAISGKPLICILDQVEEAFTQSGGNGIKEIEIFANALNGLFGDTSSCPGGKVVASFRKEYEPEIVDVFKQQKIDYTSVLLKKLGFPDVCEVVGGLNSTERLRQKYNLHIDDGLAETIAVDLLADQNTPVSPVLQIILTKLWLTKKDNGFTQKEYLSLKKEGIFLGNFFHQQMEKLQVWEQKSGKDVVSSGLALDVLNCHTTELGFASSRSMEELKKTYEHRADVLEDLIKQFKELYLLTDTGENRNSLAHDTLAPIVHQELKNSNLPGQKAMRILAGKLANYERNAGQTYIDEDDLALVEQGQKGMRLWVEAEPELVQKSQGRRSKMRFQRRMAGAGLVFLSIMAIWFGYSSYQKSQIEQWVSQARLEAITDPTTGLHSLEKALDHSADNPTVIAALNDIWSNNEFYERILPHPGPVKGVVLAPDSSGNIYSWTDQVLYRWSSEGVKKDTFDAKDIGAVAFSPDGHFFAVATKDGNILRLESDKLRQVDNKLCFPAEQITQLLLSWDGKSLFAVVRDSTLVALDAEKLIVKNQFSFENSISNLSPHPYNHTLLIGFADGSAAEYSMEGKKIRSLARHKDQVLCFALSPSDSGITSAGRDAQIIFHGSLGNPALTLKGHERPVNALQWASKGDCLFSGGNDYIIKTWSPEGDLISVYKGHTGFINGISASGDGRHFASASEDGTVRIWKTESKVKQRYGPHPGGVTGIMPDQHGQNIYTVSDQGLNDFGETLHDLKFNMEDFISAQFDLHPRNALVWDAKTGNKKTEWPGHKGGINALASDKNAEIFGTASNDTTAIIWGKTGTRLATLTKGHGGKVFGIAISPDGQHIVTVGEDSLTILWKKDGTLVKPIPEPSVARTVAFSPDAALFAVGCYDGSIHIYDISGTEKTAMMHADSFRIESVCFSPDSRFLLAGAGDNTARLYHLNGELSAIFKVFAENKTGGIAIKSVAISPDGNLFALGSEGGLVQIFRLVNDKPVTAYKLQHYPKRSILSLWFTSDGKSILTGSNDRWGRCWELKK